MKVTVPFDGLPALARILAASHRAGPCHAYWWLTFAVPGLVESPFDASSSIDEPRELPGLAAVAATFEDSGHDVRALIAAVASSRRFLAP